MQVVFQDPFSSLNPRMSVCQIIEEGLIVNGIGANRTERLDRVREALTAAGLPTNILSRFPHEFSGGQRQRIAIARAIALEPEFILLDEPTSALDLSVQAQIIDLLRKLQDERGLSYLFISPRSQGRPGALPPHHRHAARADRRGRPGRGSPVQTQDALYGEACESSFRSGGVSGGNPVFVLLCAKGGRRPKGL